MKNSYCRISFSASVKIYCKYTQISRNLNEITNKTTKRMQNIGRSRVGFKPRTDDFCILFTSQKLKKNYKYKGGRAKNPIFRPSTPIPARAAPL